MIARLKRQATQLRHRQRHLARLGVKLPVVTAGTGILAPLGTLIFPGATTDDRLQHPTVRSASSSTVARTTSSRCAWMRPFINLHHRPQHRLRSTSRPNSRFPWLAPSLHPKRSCSSCLYQPPESNGKLNVRKIALRYRTRRGGYHENRQRTLATNRRRSCLELSSSTLYLGTDCADGQESISEETKEIAWKVQHRLHKRYMKLGAAGKDQRKIVTAVARELLGFIWAIGTRAETISSNKLQPDNNQRKSKNFLRKKLRTLNQMNADIHLEHRASSSHGKHEGERRRPSLGLCDRARPDSR